MKKKLLTTIIFLLITLGGMFMLTSCEITSQTFTLNLVTTPLYENDDTAKHPYKIEWNNNTFNTSPSKFSPELAKTALILSSSAYEQNCALENLDSLGFENKATFNYDETYDPSAVGTVIASRNIVGTTLISISLRGTLGKEWFSNFDIGRDLDRTGAHEGFSKASEFVLNKLDKYIAEYSIDLDNCKFLITGHSRGAAVANLVSKSLIDAYGENRVYAYTFATPNTTINDDSNDEKYSGIFNFVNPEDFIAFIPLNSWGFTKYGTTITFPQKDTDKNYDEKLNRVAQKYENFKGRKFKTYNGTDSLDRFLSTAQDLAPTVKDYYDTEYEILGDKMSLYEYMNMVAQILNEENLISNGLILLSSDDSAFSEIKNFILKGMNVEHPSLSLGYESSLISYAHTAETYLAWLEVYIEDM